MDLVLVVLICRPLLSSQRLARSKQSCREDWIEGRLSLMIKKVVSSAKRTVESGGR